MSQDIMSVGAVPAGGELPACTIGLDVGDRVSHFYGVDRTGVKMAEGRVATTPAALSAHFATLAMARVVLECGTHSPWISRALASWGHEVIVANARRVELISRNDSKCDRVDAELLARLGRVDTQLLRPVHHRDARAQAHLAHLRSRDALVRSRSMLVTHVRGTVKAVGGRLPKCSTESFTRQTRAALPRVAPALSEVLEPVLAVLDTLSAQIRQSDRQVTTLADTTYPETRPLRAIAGVGALTALCFVLTLEDPHRFSTSRAVGSYLGLRPRMRASSAKDPELHITKAGDVLLRRLLVGSAQYILGPFGPDTDLRRWGLRLAARGKKAAKNRAVVAVARKLAVLLHHLWLTQEAYVPVQPRRRAAAAAA